MTEKKKASRKKRTPVGGARHKLSIPENIKEPGFSYRWVTDEAGKIREHLDAGYEFVQEDGVVVGDEQIENGQPTDSTISVFVGRTRYSANGVAYLMRQHMDYYNEDQEAKQREIDEVESSMFRPNTDFESSQYVSEYSRNRGSI